MQDNIDNIRFDHRPQTPYNDYRYDTLDRVDRADYLVGLLSEYETFGMDNVGNRNTVRQRSGADQVYTSAAPNLTNRYTAVGGQPLDYDAAGNLTQDPNGYRYVYDYENRTTRIYKLSGQTEIDVARYAYDALGRRIYKYDPALATPEAYYYYNDQWQILAEYTSATACRHWFAYGNYVDEVLSRSTHPTLSLALQYYTHDHLYSPAALTNYNAYTVWERYEYDAYGKVTMWNSGTDGVWYTADDAAMTSSTRNIFFFTGRQLDTLDGGALHHMHYRHRDYSPQLGRFMQHDPLGIVPSNIKEIKTIDDFRKLFYPFSQYFDGMNLYGYGRNNSLSYKDPFGLDAYEDCRDSADSAYNYCLGRMTAICGATAIIDPPVGALCFAAYYFACNNDLDSAIQNCKDKRDYPCGKPMPPSKGTSPSVPNGGGFPIHIPPANPQLPRIS